MHGAKRAVRRRTEHTLAGKAADKPGDVCVRNGAAGVDDAAERVAAHGLDDRAAVLPRREAGADADDDRRVGDPCAKVALGRMMASTSASGASASRQAQPGVGEHGNDALREQGARLVRVCGQTGGHILDRRFAVDDGWRTRPCGG